MGVCAFPPSKLSLGENAEGTATCPSFTAATENMTIHLNTKKKEKNGSPDSGRRLFHCFEFLFLFPFYVSYPKKIFDSTLRAPRNIYLRTISVEIVTSRRNGKFIYCNVHVRNTDSSFDRRGQYAYGITSITISPGLVQQRFYKETTGFFVLLCIALLFVRSVFRSFHSSKDANANASGPSCFVF